MDSFNFSLRYELSNFRYGLELLHLPLSLGENSQQFFLPALVCSFYSGLRGRAEEGGEKNVS